MTEKIFGQMVHDAQRGWDAFESHLTHRRYHDPDVTATPAPEATMSILDTVETEIHNLADHAKRIEQEILPAAISGAKDVEQLASSNVGQALLAAAHVPSSEIDGLLLPVIKWLSNAYAPETASPAPAAPADPPQPEPVPAAG